MHFASPLLRLTAMHSFNAHADSGMELVELVSAVHVCSE